MFLLHRTLCEFPDAVLYDGIGDELLVLSNRRFDIGESPIYRYANSLHLVCL